jgi:hypothetical protein
VKSPRRTPARLSRVLPFPARAVPPRAPGPRIMLGSMTVTVPQIVKDALRPMSYPQGIPPIGTDLGTLWTLERGKRRRTLRVVVHPRGLDLVCETDGELLWSRVFTTPSELVPFADEYKRDQIAKGWTERPEGPTSVPAATPLLPHDQNE